MATRSIRRKLDHQKAIVKVPMDHARSLRPQDPRAAIRGQTLDGSSFLIIMGTAPKAVITTEHILHVEPSECTSDTILESIRREATTTMSDADVLHMNLSQKVVNASLKRPELYQMPLAWGVYSQCKDNDVVINNVRERMARVFRHLGVNLGGSLYKMFPTSAFPFCMTGRIMLVVRCDSETPEIYVGNRLVYPNDHSGALAQTLNKLGLGQIYRELEDDEDQDGDTDSCCVTHG